MLGSFVIGLLWGAFEETTVPPNLRTFLFIGILGAFTTFSSFSLETLNLLRDGEVKLAMANILISAVSGLALCFLGLVTSKYLIHVAR